MTSVKHFHSAMPGAPNLTGQAGSLIAVLDACLVNGFGLQTASSVVVAGGVATVTLPAAHPFDADTIALVAGASTSAINGEKRATSRTASAFTFAAPGVPDGTIAGTITVRLAPAGWAKPFVGTNLAAYRSSGVTGTRYFLRVNDTNAQNARVVGFENMTDISTGVGKFPSDAQQSGGAWWPKANSADSNARAWTLVADGRTFWLHMQTSSANPGAGGSVWGFGDFTSYKSGDAFACALQAAASDQSGSSSEVLQSVEYVGPSPVAGLFAPRSFTAIGSAVAIHHCGESYVASAGTSGTALSSSVPVYPNGPNNALIFTRKVLTEPNVALRGLSRGVLFPVQNCHANFAWRDKVAGQGDFAGRQLLAVKCGGPAVTSSAGVMFFDITGPWS